MPIATSVTCKKQEMFNYHNFDEVFGFDPECSYDEAAIHGIDEHRKALEGLFLDKVLKLLQIKRRESNWLSRY